MIVLLLITLDDTPMIIASRFTHGGGTNDNFIYICSYLFNFFVRIILFTRLQDNLSGYFSIRRERLFSLDFNKIFWGYGDYFFRLVYYMSRKGVAIFDIPVYYEKPKHKKRRNLLSLLIRYTIAVFRLRFFG